MGGPPDRGDENPLFGSGAPRHIYPQLLPLRLSRRASRISGKH